MRCSQAGRAPRAAKQKAAAAKAPTLSLEERTAFKPSLGRPVFCLDNEDGSRIANVRIARCGVASCVFTQATIVLLSGDPHPETGEVIPEHAVGVTLNSVHEAGREFLYDPDKMLGKKESKKESKDGKVSKSKGKGKNKSVTEDAHPQLADLEGQLIAWPEAWLVANTVACAKKSVATSSLSLSSSSAGGK